MIIHIKAATIVDASSSHHLTTKDILIENGSITKIAEQIVTPENAKVIEEKNLHVSCGWFDSSVCFGEPGLEDNETVANGLQTAALSGFTNIMVNPVADPVIDAKAGIEYLLNKAKGAAVNVYPVGALTMKSESVDLAELYDMKQGGAIAFGDYKKPISNANLLKIALLYAQNFNGLVQSYPQNNDIAGKGIVNEEHTSTKLGLKGIPVLAETLQIARDLFILEYTGGKLHIPTISTAASVNLIREAKAKGLQVTCSVAIHNLVFTDKTLEAFDTNFKVVPPLRTQTEIDALLVGIKDGTIDTITTDHAPINVEHKLMEFDLASNGTIGLESAFGALQNLFTTEETVSFLTKGKATFGITNHAIEEKNIADLTLFNPEEVYTFSKENIHSTSCNSAFLGTQLKGKVYGVVNNNTIVLNS